MSEDEIPDFDDLDEFLDEEPVELTKTTVLVVASMEVFSEFAKVLAGDTYRIIYTNDQKEAISHLIQEKIAITFIDFDAAIDVAKLSSSIHDYIPLCRIILITRILNVAVLSPIINNGQVDAILQMPFSQNMMMNTLSLQEAKYSINKMLISMINDPPQLSKASFLLLDPTLQFGAEDKPLNFVGLMVVHNTVPKYTKFFEKTLAQDEFLFAGYLSSISSLGKSLFESDEALREINFGGISVIFQFHDDLQFFYFVRNLTRQNYPQAEERVTRFTKIISENHVEDFRAPYLTQENFDAMDMLAKDFDEQDDEIEETIDKLVEERTVIVDDAPLLIYSRLQGMQIADSIVRLNENTMEDDFKLLAETIVGVDEILQKVRDINYDVLMLDADFDSGERSPADFIEYIKELSPSLQIIYIEREDDLPEAILSAFNQDTVNYILPFNTDDLFYYEVFKLAKRAAMAIKQQSQSESKQEIAGTLEAMKMYLRSDQDAYTEEEIPALQGIIIAEKLNVIFDTFWFEQQYDTEIIAGLINSLESIGEEMFFEKEEIQLIELAGYKVFIKNVGDFTFSFFVDNVNPTTSVLINKEVDAVTDIYVELLNEAAGIIPYSTLHPLFSKLSNQIRVSFSKMLF